ncbi:hypothetical protein GmHk_05G013613 [Glycine max]|nr:hypothetical protein GmHk_05G013613 [Glycine max]
MAESTRSTATSDQLEDALTKLTIHQLYLTHTIQQLMQKIDALIHHLSQPAPPSHFPSSSAITASHGCLSLYFDHARPQHPPVHLFPPPSSSTTIPSSSSAKALLAHIPMPTPPLMLTPPPTPPPPFMPTPPPTPPPPPLPALRQQHPTPVSAPPTIAVIPLLVNSKPHAPSDRRWATLFQICKEYPSRRTLSSDLCSFSLVTIVAKVGGTELDHSFLFTFYATIDAVKWLYFRNTNHLSLIPSPILIWDPGSNFGAMVVAPTP